MDALIRLKMQLEGGNQINKGLEDAAQSMTELEKKTDALALNLKSIDSMSMGELRREIRSLKNIDIDLLPDSQINQIETRMAMAMDAMGDKQQEMKARGMNAFETIAGGANVVAASFETIVGAASLLGVEGETMKYLESKMTSMIATVQGLSTVYSIYESGQLKSIGLNIRDMFMTGKAAIAKLFYAGATTTATVATTMFGRALQIAMGPIGWIVLGVTALISLFKLYKSNTDKTTTSEEDLKKQKDKLNESFEKSVSLLERENSALDKNYENYKKLKDIKGQTSTLMAEEINLRQSLQNLLAKEGFTKMMGIDELLKTGGKDLLGNVLPGVVSKSQEIGNNNLEMMDKVFYSYVDLIQRAMDNGSVNLANTYKNTAKILQKLFGAGAGFNVDIINNKGNIETKNTKELNRVSEIKALTVNITKMIGIENFETNNFQGDKTIVGDEMKRQLQLAIADVTRQVYK